MSQETFNQLAQESILFAQFKAETDGVEPFVIELWMRELVARMVC